MLRWVIINTPAFIHTFRGMLTTKDSQVDALDVKINAAYEEMFVFMDRA